ncbi:PIR protein [Plasmodium ovale]|uniref:PIR protein n=1 Tax=Plasmodium ovale TaxID=36330 RepID=A0A1D3JET0_PLAOA|nr:PIR protein [Plasmodium ovale]
MKSEKEDYNIFSNLHEYKGLEIVRMNDQVGMSDINFCHSLGEKFGDSKHKIEKPCKQFLQLCTQYTVLKILNTFNDKNFCEIMNYWLNFDLREFNDKDKLELDFFPLMMTESNKKFKKLNCTLDLHKIEENELNNLQILYELYDNFYKRFDTVYVPQKKFICKSECNHKRECANIFNNNIDRCSSKNQSKFCDALQQFRHKYMDDTICPICPDITPLKPYPIEEQLAESLVAETEDSAKHMNHVTQESTNDHSSTGKYTFIPIFLSITVGIFFTPLGDFLNSRIIKNKMLRNNLQTEDCESVLSNYETEQIFSEDIPYHIAYHSS